jgi:hypothetical protein
MEFDIEFIASHRSINDARLFIFGEAYIKAKIPEFKWIVHHV